MSLNFVNFNNLNQEPYSSRTHEVRKKSPLTLKRNAAKKQKFLEERMTPSVRKPTCNTSFKCDQCDHEANCEVGLRKHIGRDHKVIPQIDGINDISSADEKSSPTKEIKFREVEVQTESKDTVQTEDSLDIVLTGEIAKDCEEEYIGETFWKLPAGFYYDNWYTDSVRRAPQGYWVNRSGEIRNRTTGAVIGKVS